MLLREPGRTRACQRESLLPCGKAGVTARGARNWALLAQVVDGCTGAPTLLPNIVVADGALP